MNVVYSIRIFEVDKRACMRACVVVLFCIWKFQIGTNAIICLWALFVQLCSHSLSIAQNSNDIWKKGKKRKKMQYAWSISSVMHLILGMHLVFFAINLALAWLPIDCSSLISFLLSLFERVLWVIRNVHVRIYFKKLDELQQKYLLYVNE